ncbi:hypothetical protein Rhe02_11020 [Rhizocola hellebori]|uniref:DUF417 family protein n=1 Tax=Rhizocola hellebori TaxID=1392758 RepID=A0A8J3Q4E0_9ACTN|nr:DoxX family protein [Rhizocola hellebori]GIH03035.1 hypothetical protein Rhe02_11020 [Rhizocola hellebori]
MGASPQPAPLEAIMDQLINPAQKRPWQIESSRLWNRRVAQLKTVAELYAHTLLRISLGLVFLWFGLLKFTPVSPVAKLVADTVPFVPARVLVPTLAALEVVIGIALLLGRWTTAVVAVMIAHLSGTFLVLVVQPTVAFQNGNPLELTMTGEFVVKNVVLITAALVLLTRVRATADPND